METSDLLGQGNGRRLNVGSRSAKEYDLEQEVKAVF